MTTFNPSHFEHEGVRYEAKEDPAGNCDGCAFEKDSASCSSAPFCIPELRPDGKNIIWVKAQEENKS